MSTKDPKGYYAILDILPTAVAAEIKAAYRRRAMELHPDRNKSPNATKEFQLLNEAYGVLSDPSVRAQYDTISVETKDHNTAASKAPPEPIVCSFCAKVTAQPRYVIFYEVKSFIFVTRRTPIQGIFCSACAEKKALRATALTWLLGWWGIPWGFVYSLHAIFVNLIGGERPRNINARLAAHQAWVFALLGKIEIARAIALDALALAQKIKPDNESVKLKKSLGYEVNDEGARLSKEIEELLAALDNGDKAIRLKDFWVLFRRPFYIQGMIGLAMIALVWTAILNDTPNPPLRGPKPYIATPAPAAPLRSAYVRPATTPNGKPWPTIADYIPGYRSIHTNGLSTVTVDNSQNDSDVFVKLVSLNGSNAFPVRVFFIPAHGQFTLNRVTAGNYDIRYRDLSNGRLSRSEVFSLKEISTYDGTQYSNVTMTLYKVHYGNMQTYGLSEMEF